MTGEPREGLRRRLLYPPFLRRAWRHPRIQSANAARLAACADLRARLEYAAAYATRFRSGYTREHYTARDIPECRPRALGILRPGHTGAAVLYALGIDSYDEVRRILSVPEGDPRALPLDTNARSQAAPIARHIGQRPGPAVDVRCGRGEAASTLAQLAIAILPVGTSARAESLVWETARRFEPGRGTTAPFLNKGRRSAPRLLRRRGTMPDAVIFCESIEHMPEGDVRRSFELMSRMAGRRGCAPA